jgi:cytosine/uracil/thiamine/allantoin permease
MQVCIVVRGIDTIKDIETCSAPILVALAVALLVWALSAAGGLGPMLAAPSQVRNSCDTRRDQACLCFQHLAFSRPLAMTDDRTISYRPVGRCNCT